MRLALASALLWAALPALGADTTPPSAAVLSPGTVIRRAVEVVWTAPGGDGATGTAAAYDLRWSPIGPLDTLAGFLAAVPVAGLPAPKPAGSREAFTVVGLDPDTTYYFALRARDEVPNWSPLSPSLQVKTLAPVPPGPVYGLRAERSGADLTLRWSPVTVYADGTPADQDLVRYTVWKAPALDGPYAQVAAVPQTAAAYTDAGSLAAPAWYRVTAGDVYGKESEVRETIENGPETRLILPSPDGLARLEVPAAAQGPLLASGNPYGSDLAVAWTRRGADESGKVYLSYELSAVRAADGAPASFTFPQPGASLILTLPGGAAPEETAIFRFDGVEYAKIGGRAAGAALQAGITQPGRYRLQQSLRAAAFRVERLTPRKVFTPNGDGINDTIAVYFENPADEAVSGEIFDVTGSRVAAMRRGPTSDSLQWDGRDAGGGEARPGVYIYQLKCGGSTVNGTIVLVR